MNAKVLLIHLRQSFNDWNEDNAPRLGAALAFYTILSISPLVILAIAIVSLIVDRSRVQSQLLAQVQGLVGSQGCSAGYVAEWSEAFLGYLVNSSRGDDPGVWRDWSFR